MKKNRWKEIRKEKNILEKKKGKEGKKGEKFVKKRGKMNKKFNE